MERYFRIALTLLCTSALSGCWTADVRDALKKQPAPPPPTVIVRTVGRQTVPIVSDFTARTVGTQTIDVKARVEGVLEQVRFEPGALVHKGETLFVIQRGQYEAAVLSAKAGVMKAQADLRRAQNQEGVRRAQADAMSASADLGKANLDVKRLGPLAKQRAVPQQDLDNAVAAQKVAQARYDAVISALSDAKLDAKTQVLQAQAGLENAQAQLTQANLNLDYTVIRAPVTGLIGLLKVDQGNLVGRGDATLLATLVAVDPMRVDFSISEIDYLYLENNALPPSAEDLRLVLADNSLYPEVGHPTALNNQLDPTTGTIIVQARFPNPQGKLRPGQFARVRVVAQQQKNALLVPQRAVVELQGTKTVRIVGKDDKVRIRTVSLGPRYADSFVVDRGLAAGDRVIVEGVQKVQPEMVVNPVEQTALAK